MRAEWRRLATWPYAKLDAKPSGFEVGWNKTIDDLAKEITLAGGTEPIIGIVALEDQFRLDGQPKTGFKVLYRGAEVGFDAAARRLVFHTDAFRSLQENLRAISLGLTALRTIERYGITTANEQYAGFAQLGSGLGDPERGRALVREHGTIAAALKAAHPDHGGTAAKLADVLAYKKEVGA